MKIYLNSGRVKKEWTDYNGHMNLAFYIHLFDAGWEVLLQKFNMGETSAKTEKKTTFAVESHTTYDKEVKEGDEVDINLLFLEKSYPLGVIAISGNFFLKLCDTLFM